MDDEGDWRKQLLVGLGVLVIAALLVGGVVGVIAIKAADVAGIGETPSSNSGGRLTFPTFKKTSQPSSTEPTTPQAPTGSTPPTTSAKPPKTGIELTASPTQAGTYQRVDLSGTYSGASPGTSLQVQRREGSAWVDFPTSATVNGGQFGTYIETGHPGPNRFRVFDAATSMASNVVTVQIG